MSTDTALVSLCVLNTLGVTIVEQTTQIFRWFKFCDGQLKDPDYLKTKNRILKLYVLDHIGVLAYGKPFFQKFYLPLSKAKIILLN